MIGNRKKYDMWSWIAVALLLLFLLFFIYPCVRLMWEAFYTQKDGFTVKAFVKFFSKSYYTKTIGNSFKVSGAVMLNAGAEYCFADILFARAGFHYGDAAKAVPTFISAGLGAKYAGVQLDAAYIFASPTIGNSLMLTLGYAF